LDTSYFRPIKDLTHKEVAEEDSEIDVKNLQEDHPFKNFDNIDYSNRDEADRKEQEAQQKEKKKKSPSVSNFL